MCKGHKNGRFLTGFVVSVLCLLSVGCPPGGVDVVVVFPDANLDSLIRRVINKPTGDILATDLVGPSGTRVEGLIADNADIADLTGLDYCTDLTTLNLGRNQIEDISALVSLTRLKNLNLEGNSISDISALGGLTSLTKLYLYWNQITDISAVASLTSLTTLHLDGNQISDISALVVNAGVDFGDSVWLEGNPLSEDAACVDIPTLEERGVNVYYSNCGGVCGVEPPVNDDCANAIPISVGGSYWGSNVCATGDDLTSLALNDYNDVWFTFTPETDLRARFSLCGSTFDTTLAVFDACDGNELACNDDSCGYQSAVSLFVTANTTYLVRVAGYDGSAGDYVLDVVFHTGKGTSEGEGEGGKESVSVGEGKGEGEGEVLNEDEVIGEGEGEGGKESVSVSEGETECRSFIGCIGVNEPFSCQGITGPFCCQGDS